LQGRAECAGDKRIQSRTFLSICEREKPEGSRTCGIPGTGKAAEGHHYRGCGWNVVSLIHNNKKLGNFGGKRGAKGFKTGVVSIHAGGFQRGNDEPWFGKGGPTIREAYLLPKIREIQPSNWGLKVGGGDFKELHGITQSTLSGGLGPRPSCYIEREKVAGRFEKNISFIGTLEPCLRSHEVRRLSLKSLFQTIDGKALFQLDPSRLLKNALGDGAKRGGRF